MKDDEVLLALYNGKVEKKEKHYLVKDTVLDCNIPVTSQIKFLRGEELVESDSLRLTSLGKDEVIRIMEERLKR